MREFGIGERVDGERLDLRERAHGIDETSAGTHGACGADEQRPLHVGECRDVARLHSPTCVRPASQHAEPGARRVDQHPIEGLIGERQPASVGDDRDDDGRSATTDIASHGANPCRMHVAGDDKPVVAHAFGGTAGLPAGRGSDIEDPFSRLGVERRDDRLARLILGCDPPGAQRSQRPRSPL